MRRLLVLLFAVFATWMWLTSASPSMTYAMGYHATSYWCNNTNYPLVAARMGVDHYDDLASAYIAQQWSDEWSDYKLCVCNIVVVKRDTNEAIATDLARVVIEKSEDGPSFYAEQDGQWVLLKNYGYMEALYNTGWVLMHYFDGLPI